MLVAFIGFLCIILLVIAHEAGHFFAARKSGVEVEEFGVGFPPKAKTIGHKNGTEYTINWLPLGGFVRLKGENDADETPGSFGAARLRDKVKIMLAGVAVNALLAYILLTFLALIGMPQLLENQYTVASDATVTKQEVLASFIAEDSPAFTAGIKPNDVIKNISLPIDCAIGCHFGINTSDDLRSATQSLAGEDVIITVSRSGQDLIYGASLLSEEEVLASRETENPRGYLGVVPGDFSVVRSTWSAPIVGAGVTWQFAKATLSGLGSIVTGLSQGDTTAATENVSGVIGIGYIFKDTSFLGLPFMIMIIATISLSLAIMNVLPIPALDGGRLFVTLLYRVLRKPLTKEAEERIHGTGMVVLLIIFALVTVVDVQRFII